MKHIRTKLLGILLTIFLVVIIMVLNQFLSYSIEQVYAKFSMDQLNDDSLYYSMRYTQSLLNMFINIITVGLIGILIFTRIKILLK